MKNYEVRLYYSGCVYVRVSAPDARTAVENAEMMVNGMSDREFCEEADFVTTGYDAEEIK